MSRSHALSLAVLLLTMTALVGGGCSAIVAPDPSRLGGGPDAPSIDVGAADTGGRDTGSVPDGGMRDGGGTDAPILECVRDADCDDSVACTDDFCRMNDCVFVANDGLCEDDERCSEGAGCVPIVCTTNAECSDANACNGMETCNPGGPGADSRTGCVDGAPPACSDGLTCTADSCDPAVGCVFTPNDAACDDGVACTTNRCSATAGPTGCEYLPDNTACNAGCTVGATCNRTMGCMGGAPRDCSDMTDCTVDSCDVSVPSFCVNDPLDADMDGAPAETSPSGMTCAGGTDCDDGNANVGPGETEVCNGIDDDCNGTTDEGCPTIPDDCGSAVAIPLSSGMPRTGQVNAMFSTFAANYPACSGTGRDAVYYIDLDAASDVRIDTMGSGVADTVLGVSLGTCTGASFAAACNDDQDPSSVITSRIWLHNIGPRTPGTSLRVFILVKSYAAAATGAFRVNVAVSPARADSCAEPLDITGGGLVVGAIAPSVISLGQRGSCDPDRISTAAEAVFRVTGPSDNQLWSIDAYSMSFTPILYTRGVGTSSCNMAGSESSCDLGSGGAARVENVAAMSTRTNYVFVDGASMATSASPYALVFDP